MSSFMTGNILLILSMTATAVSQVMLKAVLNQTESATLQWETLREIFATPALAIRTAIAFVLVFAGFGLWMLSLSRLNLSYAYPVASSSVLLVAFLSGFFLGEPITLRVWGGTVLILLGIVLLTPGAGS